VELLERGEFPGDAFYEVRESLGLSVVVGEGIPRYIFVLVDIAADLRTEVEACCIKAALLSCYLQAAWC
jgi:hypothetical protein